MKRLRPILIYTLLAVIVIVLAVRLVNRLNTPHAALVSVRGTVTRGGKPLSVDSPGAALHVIFLPAERDDMSVIYPAQGDGNSGRYELSEIPPGRYVIAVQLMKDGRDLLGLAFDPSQSNLIREITHDGQVLDIDLPPALST